MRFVAIKAGKIIVLVSFFSVFLCPRSFPDNLITILNPVEATTSNSELFIEGKTEESFIKSLELSVEPFILKENEKTSVKRIIVRDGYFSEKIGLSQGLNLIRLLTLNGNQLRVIPIFLISKESNFLGQEKEWGAKSGILFASPSEIKTNSNPCEFKGMVTDPKLKSLDVVILDSLDLVSPDTNKHKQGIDYLNPQVTGQQFIFSANLREGLNIILVKPFGKPAEAGSMQIKSLIYEKTSLKILLNDPEINNNKLNLSGKITNLNYNKITIKIAALAARKENPENLFYQTILSKIINAQPDGSFSLNIPWEKEKNDYIIKAFPTIHVYAGNESATKTLTQW